MSSRAPQWFRQPRYGITRPSMASPVRADIDAMQTVLENAGVEFTNGVQTGVRLRK